MAYAVARRERGAAEADRFRGDQNALRIHAVKNVLEAAALLADPIVDRNLQSVDEHLVRVDRLASHFLDLAHLDEAAIERGIEQA